MYNVDINKKWAYEEPNNNIDIILKYIYLITTTHALFRKSNSLKLLDEDQGCGILFFNRIVLKWFMYRPIACRLTCITNYSVSFKSILYSSAMINLNTTMISLRMSMVGDIIMVEAIKILNVRFWLIPEFWLIFFDVDG